MPPEDRIAVLLVYSDQPPTQARVDIRLIWPLPPASSAMDTRSPSRAHGNEDHLCGAEEQIVGFLSPLCLLGFDDVSGRPDFMVSQSWRIVEAAAATHQPTTCRD
jgi:hypothetical protein